MYIYDETEICWGRAVALTSASIPFLWPSYNDVIAKFMHTIKYSFIVGPGPTVLAVGAGGVCLDIFSLVYQFSLLSPSLWETARYRLKYCLKGSLSQKQLEQIRKVPRI